MILDYEERWRPTHVRVLRSTPGGPHLPPPAPPFLSHAVGEEGGRMARTFP
jgi:hypothetical protein